MKTRIKVTAAAALLAAFAGASADEARLDELIVIGKRTTSAAPMLEIERAEPKATLESFVPTIEVPAINSDLMRFLHDAD